MKKFAIVCMYIICQFMYSAGIAANNVLNLFSNGTSPFVVVLNKNAGSEEERAASVFRYYFKKVTDFNLPVSQETSFQYKIYIKQDSALPFEGFSIKATDQYSIYISGGKQNGTVNAVWYFLKKHLGIEYLSLNTVYLNAKETIAITIPFAESQKPSFSTRTLYSLEGYDFDYTEAHALQIPFVSHHDFAHTFDNDLLPPKNYFKSHPEYYITYNGKKDSSQPNLLNPDVLNIVLENLKRKIKQDTSNKYQYYSISLNDNPLVSEDAETQNALAKGGQNYTSILLNFVNRIADSIPNRKFTTLAYEQTKSFPASVKPRKNVTIILTNADNNKSKSIDVDDYDQIQRLHMKSQIPLWVSFDPNLIFWDYIANFSHSIVPWPNLYTFKPNLQFYKKTGINHLFIQNAGLFPAENSELKAYLCSNLMWNINYNDDSLIQVFCQKYYQDSWKVLYNYIRDINMQSKAGKDVLFTYDNPIKFKNTLYKYDNLMKWLTMLRKAEMEERNTIIKKRILKERLGLDYVLIEISANSNDWNNSDDKNALDKRIVQFKKDCIEAGISKLNPVDGSLERFTLEVQQKIQSR